MADVIFTVFLIAALSIGAWELGKWVIATMRKLGL
jgi:hypothetical protein